MKEQKNKIQTSIPEKIFTVLNYTMLTSLVLICLYPFLNIVAYSFSSSRAVLSGWVTIFPIEFQTDAYKEILRNSGIWRSMGVTVFVTITSTAIGMLLTIGAAYGLSKKRLKGRKFLTMVMLFTMYFGGGIIPTFLVVKNLGLIDTLGALIFPSAMSVFYFIIMKTFFLQIPQELEESAILDGCNDLQVLSKIILPLSLPIIATIGLFYAVAHWNEYFSSMMYINNPDKYTLQLKLRQLLFTEQLSQISGDLSQYDTGSNLLVSESLKGASIVVSTLPIIIVYPWLQKYFVKGVMVGSIKG